MSIIAQAYTCNVMEDGDAYALARLKKKDATHNMVIVAQSDFSSITRIVYDTTDDSVVLTSASVVVADVILNALSTGTIWDKNDEGFNFIHQIAATAFPNGNRTYRLLYTFTLTGGLVFQLPFNAVCVDKEVL